MRSDATSWLLAISAALLAFAVGVSSPQPDWTGALVATVMYGAVSLVPLTLPRGDSLQAGCGVAVASLLLLDPATAVLGAVGGLVLSALIAWSLEESMAPTLLDAARVPILVGSGWLRFCWIRT